MANKPRYHIDGLWTVHPPEVIGRAKELIFSGKRDAEISSVLQSENKKMTTSYIQYLRAFWGKRLPRRGGRKIVTAKKPGNTTPKVKIKTSQPKEAAVVLEKPPEKTILAKAPLPNPETKKIADNWIQKHGYALKNPIKIRCANAIITANLHLSPKDFVETTIQRLNVLIGE